MNRLRSLPFVIALAFACPGAASAQGDTKAARPAAAAAAVDPRSWLLPEGEAGPIPFRNTIRQSLPEHLKPLAGNVTDTWPDAAYFRSTKEVAQHNGGHQTLDHNAVTYSSLRTLTHESRNKGRGKRAEGEGGRPVAADGTITAMHGYNGHVARHKDWGFGPDLLVEWTWFRANDVPNSIAYYDIAKEFGGGDVFYKGADNRFFVKAQGNYGVAVECDFMRGFFVGDANDPGNPESFAFIRGDKSLPDFSWPNPLAQYKATTLAIDEDRKLLIGLNSGKREAWGTYYPPYLTVVDLDEKSPTFKRMTTVKFTWPDPALELAEMNRSGFAWLKGKGIVGLVKVSPTESWGVQIALGANPRVDPPTAKVVFKKLPTVQNGFFGSHVAIADLGITFVNTGPDSMPWQIVWPKL